jgi:hypothetical protein
MNEKQPRWTIKSKEVNMGLGFHGKDNKKPSYTEHTLRFDGKKVFTAKTPIAAQTLQELCDKWNAEGYAPNLVNGKLLCEMSESERLKLAAIWSPALPFGEEAVS